MASKSLKKVLLFISFFYIFINGKTLVANEWLIGDVGIFQGLSAGKRIIPIIDTKNNISSNESLGELKLNDGSINFSNVNFNYESNLDTVYLKI